MDFEHYTAGSSVFWASWGFHVPLLAGAWGELGVKNGTITGIYSWGLYLDYYEDPLPHSPFLVWNKGM